MSDSNADVYESLTEGDLIQFDGRAATENPHVVKGDGPTEMGMLAVEGPGGASKMMIQNKHDPDSISIMSMGNRNDHGTWIKNLRKVSDQ